MDRMAKCERCGRYVHEDELTLVPKPQNALTGVFKMISGGKQPVWEGQNILMCKDCIKILNEQRAKRM